MSTQNQSPEMNNSQQQNEGNKVEKAFESNMKKLVAILGGKELFASTKTDSSDLETIVADLVKEKKEETAKTVKEGLKKLLSQYTEMNKAIADKKKELAKLEETKKKEFNDEIGKLLGKVENVGQIERDYYQALGGTPQTTAQEGSTEEKQD